FQSIWCVAVAYYGVVLLRQHDLALSAIAGSILNTLLSFTLKHILNQERPVSEVCSGPGMPSTHAQSISFAVIFFNLLSNQSYFYWMAGTRWIFGHAYCSYYHDCCIFSHACIIITNIILMMLCCSFMQSWLRVLLGYHTTSQVVVGVVVGSIFSVLWFCSHDMFLI
ncbi:lipid phosphate phosphatase epsilon 2, chloroplastic-like, partial [Bidens hawaiensis]|uniref:lipid phosphate phosphatase epsilon 2, chloroplastic-like n=1 Tax=Bidens hawaiensis TaxID=980011 RepID=UPI00404A5E43